MNTQQINQFFQFILDSKTKGFSPEFWQDLKAPFISDPTLLIQLTEISGQNYQSQTNIQNVITAKIKEDSNYAKTLETWLSKIEIANKVEDKSEEENEDEKLANIKENDQKSQ